MSKAKRELARIAKGEHHSLGVQLTINDKGGETTQARIYLHGYGCIWEKTFEECFKVLAEMMGKRPKLQSIKGIADSKGGKE